jgi:hypothetical protein
LDDEGASNDNGMLKLERSQLPLLGWPTHGKYAIIKEINILKIIQKDILVICLSVH